MTFSKGYTPWNKRIKCPNISKSKKGKHCSPKTEFKKGHRFEGEIERKRVGALKGKNTWMKGTHHSEETRRKMRNAHLGKKERPMSEIGRKNISRSHIGIKYPPCSNEFRELKRRQRLHQIFPRKDTSIEIKLQNELSFRNIQFQKHYPIIGQPDIVFPDKKIAIFTDGDYWHNRPEVKVRDKKVNEELRNDKQTHLATLATLDTSTNPPYSETQEKEDIVESVQSAQNSQTCKLSWLVLRFSESEINSNVKNVVDRIEKVI